MYNLLECKLELNNFHQGSKHHFVTHKENLRLKNVAETTFANEKQ